MPGSQSSVFDSELYSSLFTQPEMKSIWSDDNLLRCWLTFEATIAHVQTELGIIPPEAAAEISAACQTLKIDWPRLARETRSVGMAIKPLVDQIADAGSPLVKKYLHWGCTTQDLLDTALAMRMKQTLQLLRRQLVQLGETLKAMALEHRHTVMVARTNSVDASATTWGLHVSSYLSELTRHLQRLDRLYPAATTGLFGGAVGNLASVGSQGMAIRKQLMGALGLSCPVGMSNASQDHVVEVVQFFALVHGTLCRMANDVETQGRTSVGELREGEGGGGSSTMPHKTNPRASNMIQTLSRMGWNYASGATSLLDQCDVRAASARVLNWTLVPESALVLSASLERAVRLITHLVVDKEKMRSNFAASKNFIMSESVTMVLAEKIGRGAAYDLMKALLKDADGSKDLLQCMLENQTVIDALTESEIVAACDPLSYLGCNDALIEETVIAFDDYIHVRTA
ncbi:adenylosuccinate lyase family protein [Escherichia coli]|uniref:Adenylosuccinate lyase n=4 Tax=Enterobacteriaceae TaxID=543 RepID=A0AAP7NTA1_ECOLX|nr:MULTISPECIES: adenylosuccinate lyase family protein [Enterobacteriaceae]EKA8357622.1 adenylosuccinate lyase family protein [Salmonella enterica]EBS1451994.1 adenylosuccinate lyase family protein [Salmonella enterica subsp. enterica serovar Newport]EBW1581271.1 adenylosuccinate lyase family protein [Salmonella enterica subsp. enterica serovar Newport]ECA5295260.1 adenylosuccinate lyase family protein [Salmonella enterica subsp. enterica serovar Newport]EFM6614439.1 adenylosuccinate lyase fam